MPRRSSRAKSNSNLDNKSPTFSSRSPSPSSPRSNLSRFMLLSPGISPSDGLIGSLGKSSPDIPLSLKGVLSAEIGPFNIPPSTGEILSPESLSHLSSPMLDKAGGSLTPLSSKMTDAPQSVSGESYTSSLSSGLSIIGNLFRPFLEEEKSNMPQKDPREIEDFQKILDYKTPYPILINMYGKHFNKPADFLFYIMSFNDKTTSGDLWTWIFDYSDVIKGKRSSIITRLNTIRKSVNYKIDVYVVRDNDEYFILVNDPKNQYPPENLDANGAIKTIKITPGQAKETITLLHSVGFKMENNRGLIVSP